MALAQLGLRRRGAATRWRGWRASTRSTTGASPSGSTAARWRRWAWPGRAGTRRPSCWRCAGCAARPDRALVSAARPGRGAPFPIAPLIGDHAGPAPAFARDDCHPGPLRYLPPIRASAVTAACRRGAHSPTPSDSRRSACCWRAARRSRRWPPATAPVPPSPAPSRAPSAVWSKVPPWPSRASRMRAHRSARCAGCRRHRRCLGRAFATPVVSARRARSWLATTSSVTRTASASTSGRRRRGPRAGCRCWSS